MQSCYIEPYVVKNQNLRMNAKNLVQSKGAKALNNQLYGALLHNVNKANLKAMVDNIKEAEQ